MFIFDEDALLQNNLKWPFQLISSKRERERERERESTNRRSNVVITMCDYGHLQTFAERIS